MGNYSRKEFLKTISLATISVSPLVGSILLSGCSKEFSPQDFSSIKAFRLTIHETLFNADFYFINCAQSGNKIYAKYAQEECYMVVRLPQQHITEQNFSKKESIIKAASAISGYSYLTFRIVFSRGETDAYISLKAKKEYVEILDWNNNNKNRNYQFRLVVKKGHTHSLFENYSKPAYKDTILNGENTIVLRMSDKSDNSYPLNYRRKVTDMAATFDSSLYPKVDGQPITAIEAPWRLVLSPMISDEMKYIFSWEFSRRPSRTDDITYAELWMATLIIKDNPDHKVEKEIEIDEKPNTTDNGKVADLQNKIKAIELMIVGSPDLIKDSIEIRDTDSTLLHKPIVDTSGFSVGSGEHVVDMFGEGILPRRKDRAELVTLYIRYKLLARTDKISFTPLGIGTYIEFKNNETESNGISLISWKHLISLGRDEEVEIGHLVMDKLFGHKMIHIYSTKRTIEKGKSLLKRIEYLVPLEIEKDYSAHEDYDDDDNEKKRKVSKFNFPFKKAVFVDRDPKRIVPVSDSPQKLEFIKKDATGKTESQYIYVPVDDNGRPVQFEYLVTDWDNNVFKVTKSIQLIPYELLSDKGYNIDKTTIGEKIDTFFDDSMGSLSEVDEKINANKKALSQLTDLQEELKNVYNIQKISETISEIKRLAALPKKATDSISELTKKYRNNVRDFKAEVDSLYENKLNGLQIDSRIDTGYQQIRKTLDQAYQHFNVSHLDSLTSAVDFTRLHDIKNAIEGFNSKIEEVFDSTQLGLRIKFQKINSDIERNLNKYLWYDLFNIDNIISDNSKKLKESLTALIKTANEVNEKINNIPGAINLYRKKITYAVKDIEYDVKANISQVEKTVSENISKLETEFIAFKGKLKTDGNNVINFFDEFASVPQLDIAKVYVDKINRIVNDEIPLNIQYAEDYVKNQIDLARMEVTKNASKVFARIYENSRDLIRTEMRKLSRDLGGIVNAELPVELLTALTHPKADHNMINTLTENLPKTITESLEQARQYEKQLIFISEEAKNTFNELKQFRFQPGDFFKAFEAKILGSIRLKDILGVDFNVPNVSYLVEQKKIVYNFITDRLQEKDLGLIKFIPTANPGKEKTKIQVYADKSWDNANEYTSFSRLNNFAITIKPLGGDLLKVFFNEIKISSSSYKAKDISVKIDDVKFDGVLNFLAVLAEKIKMPGTGIRVIPSFSGIEVGYSLPLPSITSPGFNFTNIKLDLALHIHFPTSQEVRPITISIGLNRPEDKFLLSAGIYGGRGHFVLEASPDKVISIDTALEFGGVYALDIGIAKGQAFLMVGIRYQKDNLTGVVILTGYLTCGGSMTVYGFISIGVLFIMLLEYNISDNTIIGEAAVSYSIKIGFFKKSFTLHYRKVMKGTESRTERPQAATAGVSGSNLSFLSSEEDVKSFEKYYSEEEWEEYLNYFEIK